MVLSATTALLKVATSLYASHQVTLLHRFQLQLQPHQQWKSPCRLQTLAWPIWTAGPSGRPIQGWMKCFFYPLTLLIIIFQGKQNGFFLECGALDGEYLSNSLLFELQLGWSVSRSWYWLVGFLVSLVVGQLVSWTCWLGLQEKIRSGLLIEANPEAYAQLRQKQRK